MVWINFKWYVWFANLQHSELDSTAKAIYSSAYDHLNRIHQDRMKEGEQAEELDEDERSSYLDWLEDEFREQRAALAAMTFALLATTTVRYLKTTMKSVARHMPLTDEVKGGSELQKIAAEYKSRLGVDFEQLPGFETVREIVLARNCCLHNEGKPTKDYLEQTESRCLDTRGLINLTPELLDNLVYELKKFISAIGQGLSEIVAKRVAQS